MIFRPMRAGLPAVALSMCITLWMQGTATAQSAGSSTPRSALSRLGPVAEVESRPSLAEPPVNSVIDPGVIPSRQALTPAGLQSIFKSQVYGVAFGEGGDSIYAATVGRKGSFVYQINLKTNHMTTVLTSEANPGMQGLAYDPVSHTLLMSGLRHGHGHGAAGEPVPSSGQLIALGEPGSVIADGLGSNEMGSLGVGLAKNSAGHRLAVMALTFNDEAAVIDLDTKEVERRIKTGIAPFGVAVSADSSVAYISNLGGRVPHAGDRTAATGPEPNADQVLVDARGVAASGTVTRIDLVTGQVTASINVGLHPTGLAWDEAHHKLYVANSNSDTISVVDTATNRVVDTIVLRPFLKKVAGLSPESVALSPDHATLYAACAGINAVAVIDLKEAHPHLAGMIPTGWYPTDVVVSPDGKFLAVSTLLGVGSGWDSPGVMYGRNFVAGVYDHSKPELNIYHRYVHANRGTVHIIPVPDADELDRYSTAVADNNHMVLQGAFLAENDALQKPRPGVKPQPVPARMGEPSVFDHVVYIIKENRSYDQYFGDLPKGNGDPTLHVYGDAVIPNQRKLAQEFVLLDNFYANGGNSADGHQWVTQATETDYTHWPADGGRSYPKNGDDPLAFAGSGFLWDHLASHHKTFADFGEYVGEIGAKFQTSDEDQNRLRARLLHEYTDGRRDFSGMFSTTAPIARLNQYLIKDYPAYGLQVPDVVRASIFLQHLQQWENGGNMPNLVMIQLPGDVTLATSPGFSNPNACMADNDLALGKIVEGISHSKFWKSTLILVVEDDAQNGLDHVDGHRTVALAISPYTKRGSVDSTFYSQVSMVKTIELILGVPPMSLFDLIANDMRASFQSTPDLTPYESVAPTQSLFDVNPNLEALHGQARTDALVSSKMEWKDPDDFPAEQVNQILWRNAKGTQPYPAWKRGAAVFQDAAAQ